MKTVLKRNWFLVIVVGLFLLGPTIAAYSQLHTARALMGPVVMGANGIQQTNGYSSMGQGTLSITGTAASGGPFCITGSAATSQPCALCWLTISGGTALIGTSSTASGCILASSTSYTAVPCSDCNQLYITGGTGNTARYLYFTP